MLISLGHTTSVCILPLFHGSISAAHYIAKTCRGFLKRELVSIHSFLTVCSFETFARPFGTLECTLRFNSTLLDDCCLVNFRFNSIWLDHRCLVNFRFNLQLVFTIMRYLFCCLQIFPDFKLIINQVEWLLLLVIHSGIMLERHEDFASFLTLHTTVVWVIALTFAVNHCWLNSLENFLNIIFNVIFHISQSKVLCRWMTLTESWISFSHSLASRWRVSLGPLCCFSSVHAHGYYLFSWRWHNLLVVSRWLNILCRNGH